MKIGNVITVSLILVTIMFNGCGSEKKAADESNIIKFGTLPALQALPLFVAEANGYFVEYGLEVELVNFNSASEKDIAIISGTIDGYFGDLFTPAVIEANGSDIAIVAAGYDTRYDRRMFGVLGKPGGGFNKIADLKGVPTAVSSNSVIDYLTESLMMAGGLSADDIDFTEVKNIGLRMQMLLSGQLDAATLPEPLVTAAIAAGAELLADDEDLSTSQTTLIFRDEFIKNNPGPVKKFLLAVDRASRFINVNPDAARPVMVQYGRLPEPLKETYPVPRFPRLKMPSEKTLTTVVNWLFERNVISKKPDYNELTDDRFLP
ncbi:MAG: hypothetical protein CVT49_14110 [candidate division Zixibacteria bacterium HGW-Zixibacteria-1]|nr:MAG: hypothetical protein CVT49_14110 [candidate division Zixibacteria bacterium HGW-Zixibacteria-1]